MWLCDLEEAIEDFKEVKGACCIDKIVPRDAIGITEILFYFSDNTVYVWRARNRTIQQIRG